MYVYIFLRIAFHLFSQAFCTKTWDPQNIYIKKETLIGTLEVPNYIEYAILFKVLNSKVDTLFFPIEMLAIGKALCVCVFVCVCVCVCVYVCVRGEISAESH